ncbi:hypothetical protein TNCT_103661 [Trichonephila clavata]|uniref:Uncharacterized protein n=1 Tax=Trichonephila clavata TaxID=2740835 RepID=A0A8X6F137_TRICU|nr:hypothetical protein TNCT_103661 [Trichonephila clavata]
MEASSMVLDHNFNYASRTIPFLKEKPINSKCILFHVSYLRGRERKIAKSWEPPPLIRYSRSEPLESLWWVGGGEMNRRVGWKAEATDISIEHRTREGMSNIPFER